MTKAEWLAQTVPTTLLGHLRGKTSDRKYRLFACSCARRIWNAAEDCHSQEMHSQVILTEACIEGHATLREMEAARANQWGVGEYSSYSFALYAGYATTDADPVQASSSAAENAASGFAMVAQEACWKTGGNDRDSVVAAQQAERAVQVALLRDIFGNPFCPIAFSPSWRTGTAVSLARTMYDARDFSAMPILADALQDAGCDNEDILNHCRGAGPHVRGCWVVDLVLDKE
jgi:hypothetical protein